MKSTYSNIDSDQPDFNYKIILVGNKNVGKSSLTNRAVWDEFDDDERDARMV